MSVVGYLLTKFDVLDEPVCYKKLIKNLFINVVLIHPYITRLGSVKVHFVVSNPFFTETL